VVFVVQQQSRVIGPDPDPGRPGRVSHPLRRVGTTK